MTIALVQSKFAAGFGGTGAGLNLSFDAAVTAGSSVCVTFQVPPAAVITSVTATGGNTFTQDKTAELNQQLTSLIYFFSCPVIAGAPTAVNIKMTTDESTYAFMEEVTGMATSSYVDADPAKVTGGTNTSVSSGITTTTDNAYVRAAVTLNSANTLIGTGGFTAYPGTALSRQEVYNTDMGAAGAKTITATIGASDDWAVSAIAYKTGASAPTSYYLSDTVEM